MLIQCWLYHIRWPLPCWTYFGKHRNMFAFVIICQAWDYKMLVRYILSSVWVRVSMISQLSINDIWDCVFSVYPFPLWSMDCYPLFRVRSWNNGMRCMSHDILMVQVIDILPRGKQRTADDRSSGYMVLISFATDYSGYRGTGVKRWYLNARSVSMDPLHGLENCEITMTM